MEILPQEYDEEGHPVCACCGACYNNMGLGSACDECRHDFLIECEHDYLSECDR